MNKGKFGGHETFYPRQNWLFKGLKEETVLIQIKNSTLSEFGMKEELENKLASIEEYPTDLMGVGINMVKSIRFWTKSFGLSSIEKDSTIQLILLKDPFLSQSSTMLILHYLFFLQSNVLTTWHWFFSESNLISFDKEIFLNYLKEWLEKESYFIPSEKTLENDFTTFIGMYCQNSNEYFYPSIFAELKLITFNQFYKRYYRNTNIDLEIHLFLFCLLEFKKKYFSNTENLDLDIISKQANSPFKIFKKEIDFLFLNIEKINPKIHKKLKLVRSSGLKTIEFHGLTNSMLLEQIYENKTNLSLY